MPRRSVLAPVEWEELLGVPVEEEDLAREYTFTSFEMELIGRRRGAANRLGFGVQLAYMRYPGTALGVAEPARQVVETVAAQLRVDPGLWAEYGRRDATRREHASELQEALGLRTFTGAIRAELVDELEDDALGTDKGTVIAAAAVGRLRSWGVLLPSAGVLDSVAAEAITRGNRLVYEALAGQLEDRHRRALDRLLGPGETGHGTRLGWLRQSPLRPNSKQVRDHLERLRAWRALDLPKGLRTAVRQSRLLKLAREGAQMTPGDLAKFEPQRRYATLAALAVESTMTVTDEILDLNDRILGKVFTAAKNWHRDAFHDAGREINDKVRLYGKVGQLLLTARDDGTDPFEAIEAAIGWEAFRRSVAEAQALARPQDFDSLPGIRNSYTMLRRYTPDLLESFEFKAAPAAKDLLGGIETLRRLNRTSTKDVPAEAPTSFVKPRWARFVHTEDGIDRQFWELCVLAEIRNSLRSGDLWVEGSRQYGDFDSYLMPQESFTALHAADALPLPVDADADRYLEDRLALLEGRLHDVASRAKAASLPGVDLTDGRLRIAPADTVVPDTAADLIAATSAMLPRIPITDMLVEVNNWTGFANHFTHLKTGDPCRDTTTLLTVVLADGINLGLVKMAEACTGTTYQKLLRLQAMHVRDETYTAALAELVNAQHRHPFAAHWGDGTTSSSDGQRFRAGSHAESTGHVNPKYGSAPGRLVYTHIADHYAPFHTALVNVGVRDATYVIDGLLNHESELQIKEHYTDTAGFVVTWTPVAPPVPSAPGVSRSGTVRAGRLGRFRARTTAALRGRGPRRPAR